MAAETSKKLGQLSLAIVENFVSGFLGTDFIKNLKDPFERREKLIQILAQTEKVFIDEHDDRDLSKAMFSDLSQKDRPELLVAVAQFAQNPFQDSTFRHALSQALFEEFSFLPRGRIERASNEYIRILKEVLANEDEEFRSKILTAIALRQEYKSQTLPAIQQLVQNTTELIRDKSQDFIGRKYLFNQFKSFTEEHSRGYFCIIGEPGIGKTSFLAKLISQEDYVHHFNSLTEARNTPQKFYENICAQLILRYRLKYEVLPAGAHTGPHFFLDLLREITRQESADKKIVIVIDALDEVRHPEIEEGANILFLPSILPPNVYIIVTTRQMPAWKIESDLKIVHMEKDSAENIKDIEEFLQLKSAEPAMRTYLASHSILTNEFVNVLRHKSEGNFMYLRYVLPEIARGAYNQLDLNSLPQGLINYYEAHWRKMKGKNEEAWFRYKLPIIMLLSAGEKHLSIGFIARILNIPAPRVADVIAEWEPFLNREETIYSDGPVPAYRFYHLSFIDFLHSKEEVKAEKVSFREARQNILNFYDTLLGNALDD